MFKFLFFAFILSSSVYAQFDSSYCRKLIPEKFIKISFYKKECWLIAGNDSSKIYRIDSVQNVYDKTTELRKYTNSKFSSIISVNTNFALIGTSSDHALHFKDGKITKISAYNGLSDDSIQSISISKKTGRIYIETHQNGFVSVDTTFLNYSKFTNRSSFCETHSAEPDSSADNDFVWLPNDVLDIDSFPDVENDADQKSKAHIKNRQVKAIKKQLEPCDILFKRENGNLSNMVIAGFWTHTGIYVGNLKQLNAYFKGLELLNGMKPSTYIRKHYPRIYRKLLKTRNPVIESVTDGVRIAKLKKIAKVDYFAVLRPKLSREDKFLTILKTFEFYQMPYDYGFDFSNKDAVVCSGLIYKCFNPAPYKKGINFELNTLFGNPFLYPSDIVKKFDQEYSKQNNELEFILFYDCIKSWKRAFISNINEFRGTWKRSRFDFFQR